MIGAGPILRTVVARGLAVALLSAVSLHAARAQQQTGAPAGIPVPPPPVAPASTVSGDDSPEGHTFRVRVVDGRNGSPIRDAHVKLWYDEPAGTGYELATGPRGFGSMPAPVGEPLRVLVTVSDYVDCRKPLRGDPPQGYNLQTIAATGIAAENTCGTVSVHTRPGELVLFVRSQRWYEGLNRTPRN